MIQIEIYNWNFFHIRIYEKNHEYTEFKESSTQKDP